MHYRPVCLISLFFATTLALGGSPDPENSVAPPGRLFELLALNRDLPTAAKPVYRSPCDIKASPNGNILYVVEQTAKKLAVIDFQVNRLIKEISLPNEGTGAAVAPDGEHVYVTCSSDLWPNGMVCEINPGSGKVRRRLPAGHGARSPVLSHDGKTLYVCNRYGGDVWAIDVASGRILAKMNAFREPYAAAITPDDSVLVVTNCLPMQKSTDTLNTASKILLFDAKANKLKDSLALPKGSNSAMDVTITADGRYALATHLIGMFAIPASKIDGGWIHTNNIAIIDIKERKIKNDVSLDLPISGAGNPWGIGVTPDGKMLCATHAGANFMSIVDLPQLLTVADTCPYSPAQVKLGATNVPLSHDLTKIADITKRIPVKGKAPRALWIVGNKAITAGYFDDYLEIFDVGMDTTLPSATIALGTPIRPTSERMGECAYYDASLCLQKWQSCSSCHPFARSDALNWTLGVDISAPRNSKSMLYSWWTPPTSWAGRRANAFESIRAGIKSELFLQPDPVIAATLDTFFMNLKPVPSPFLVKGRLSTAALRGRDIFKSNKTDCRNCHSGPLFTDLNKHNTGVIDPFDGNVEWDTPTIIECWRTAPHDHLGSSRTVRERIENKGHSNAKEKLTKEELDDLLEFVLSL